MHYITTGRHQTGIFQYTFQLNDSTASRCQINRHQMGFLYHLLTPGPHLSKSKSEYFHFALLIWNLTPRRSAKLYDSVFQWEKNCATWMM